MSLSDHLPRYSRVILDLERMIGQMPLGERLPPERDLALRFNVSRDTVRRAVSLLCEKGTLKSRQGSGTYVCGKVEPSLAPTATPRLIGLSVPTVEVPSIAKLVTGAESACREAGYQMVLAHDGGDPSLQATQIREMIAQRVAGLVVFLDRENVTRGECVSLLHDSREHGTPIVLVDRYVAGLDIPCVLTDTARGMYELTQHLIISGRRRLAVLSWGDEAGIAERNRFSGFRHALADAGLSTSPVLHGRVGYGAPQDQSAQRIVSEWIATYGGTLPCDGIVCFVDTMARGAFRALKAAKIAVPQDVAIGAFDDTAPELDRATGLDLTTVVQPFHEMGQVAVRRLARLITGEEQGGIVKHTLLPPKLIIRSSCGAESVFAAS